MTTATIETGAADLTTLSDDDLAALFDVGDETARAAVLAEFARQDRAADQRRKAQARRAAVESEWLDAAHAHFLAAEAATCGNLTAPGSTIANPFPGLYRISDRDFARQASEEMRGFCETNPRPTRAGFLRHAFAPRRGAYAWHEPGWRESTVKTETIAPAAVAAPGPVAPGPVPLPAERLTGAEDAPRRQRGGRGYGPGCHQARPRGRRCHRPRSPGPAPLLRWLTLPPCSPGRPGPWCSCGSRR